MHGLERSWGGGEAHALWSTFPPSHQVPCCQASLLSPAPTPQCNHWEALGPHGLKWWEGGTNHAAPSQPCTHSLSTITRKPSKPVPHSPLTPLTPPTPQCNCRREPGCAAGQSPQRTAWAPGPAPSLQQQIPQEGAGQLTEAQVQQQGLLKKVRLVWVQVLNNFRLIWYKSSYSQRHPKSCFSF